MASVAGQPTRPPSGLRPRKTRCKTGCLCCRLRKKKCDERRPVCSNCHRLGLRCSWLASNEFAWRIRMGLALDKKESHSQASSSVQDGTADEHEQLLALVARHVSQRLMPSPSWPAAGDALDATSYRLLQLYVERTTPLLLAAPLDFPNPFLQDVIPIAFSDPLIMNALLSVGGFTLDADEDDSEVEAKGLRCYGQAIKEMKLALTDWSVGHGHDTVRLLLATLLFCLQECIRGNEGGTMFQHLRASRHFANAAIGIDQDAYPSDLVGVLLETYAYYELCSSLRILPWQEDIEAACRFSSVQLDQLRQYRTFGSLFGCSSALYQTIPFICQLAMKRKREIAEGTDLECHSTFESLKQDLQEWNSSSALHYAGSDDLRDEENTESVMAGNVVRNALLLFLYSAYHSDTMYLWEVMHPLVDEAIELLSVIAKLPFLNSLFWPMVVVATYAVTAEQQEQMMSLMPPGIPLVVRATKMLRWVWDSPDDIFGLDGLAKVIKAHQVNILFG